MYCTDMSASPLDDRKVHCPFLGFQRRRLSALDCVNQVNRPPTIVPSKEAAAKIKGLMGSINDIFTLAPDSVVCRTNG